MFDKVSGYQELYSQYDIRDISYEHYFCEPDGLGGGRKFLVI